MKRTRREGGRGGENEGVLKEEGEGGREGEDSGVK